MLPKISSEILVVNLCVLKKFPRCYYTFCGSPLGAGRIDPPLWLIADSLIHYLLETVSMMTKYFHVTSRLATRGGGGGFDPHQIEIFDQNLGFFNFAKDFFRIFLLL